MKKLRRFIMMCLPLAALVAVSSCSEDEPVNDATETAINDVPAQIVADFQTSYPNARSVDWSVDSLYASASFDNGNNGESQPTTVWYELLSKIKSMQATTIAYEELPEAVKTAFESSYYGSWTHANDAAVLNRYNSDTTVDIYAISAIGSFESDDKTYTAYLFYTADGLLVKLTIDELTSDMGNGEKHKSHYQEWLMVKMPSYVKDYVSSNYPNASYLHIDKDKDQVVVKILDRRVVRAIFFDNEGNWIATHTTLKIENLPEAVRSAIEQINNFNHKPENAEECITAEGEHYYIVTLKDKSGKKVEVRIDEDGTILNGNDIDNPGNGGGNACADRAEVETYIQNRYPGATIKDWDSDDKQLEVEIEYNSVKIDVVFDKTAEGYVWVSSEWDLDYRQESAVPEAIQQAISANYADYQIYYIAYIESAADGNYYEVGLKSSKHNGDIKVKFDAEGNVIAEYGKK
ncbi:MAG: PepSY-like domain-containing protein [Muribaculaceae bacterium]